MAIASAIKNAKAAEKDRMDRRLKRETLLTTLVGKISFFPVLSATEFRGNSVADCNYEMAGVVCQMLSVMYLCATFAS